MKLKDLLLGEGTTGHGSGPLDGKSKTNASNWVHSKVDKMTKGFFSDNYWRPIHQIFKEFDRLRLNWHLTEAKYEEEMTTFDDGSRHSIPIRKTWTFEIMFINNRDKQDTLYGRIVAAGAGSVEDPLARYDVVVVVS